MTTAPISTQPKSDTKKRVLQMILIISPTECYWLITIRVLAPYVQFTYMEKIICFKLYILNKACKVTGKKSRMLGRPAYPIL